MNIYVCMHVCLYVHIYLVLHICAGYEGCVQAHISAAVVAVALLGTTSLHFKFCCIMR